VAENSGLRPATLPLHDCLGIRLNGRKAQGLKFVINLITPGNSEIYAIEMSNSTLTNLKGI
jgi:alkyl sulfatase BDS1-like metallo-beta-lactamase superfamily hydrolase